MTAHPFDKIDLLNCVTGSCSPEKADAIRAHCSVCASCNAYYRSQVENQERFLQEHPAVPSPAPRAKPRHLIPFPVPSRLYAIAASLILCVGGLYVYTTSLAESGYRVKGAAALTAYVQSGDGAIERRSGNTFYPGERLQFSYSCGPENRFILLSVDSSGSVARYFPVTDDSSMVLEPGRDIPLPQSILLDDYTGPELFIAVFSKNPLSVSSVEQIVRREFLSKRSLRAIRVEVPRARAVLFHCTVEQRDTP